MTTADGASPAQAPGELRVVGTTVAREVELLLDRVAETVGRRAPRVLQVGSRPLVADRNERNWRSLVGKRFGGRMTGSGIACANSRPRRRAGGRGGPTRCRQRWKG